MMSASNTSTTLLDEKILGVTLGSNIGGPEFLARNYVHEIIRHTLGVGLECSFTVVTLHLVNSSGLNVLAPCALATPSTRKGKHGG
jgi:hypothetical protein